MRYSGLRSRIPPSAPIIGLAVVIAALAIGLIIGGSLRFVFFLLLLGVLIYVLPRALAWRERRLHPPVSDPRGTPPEGRRPYDPSVDSSVAPDAESGMAYYLWSGGSFDDSRKRRTRKREGEDT